MSSNNPLPDFEDKYEMLKLVSAHLEAIGDGTFAYHLDWSDLRVAEACNSFTKFKAHHVSAIRRKKFGALVRSRAQKPEPTLEPSRMDILEARQLRIIDHLAGNSPRTAQFRRYLLDGTSATAHLDDI